MLLPLSAAEFQVSALLGTLLPEEFSIGKFPSGDLQVPTEPSSPALSPK
jgi:hypothetical protein